MKKLFNIFCAGLACCGAVTALISCSDDTYDPDPEKNWAGTTETFVPTDENGFRTYYNPAIGRCGDPMPFFDRKTQEFKVLYLQEYDNNGECYHPFGVSAPPMRPTMFRSVRYYPQAPATDSRMLFSAPDAPFTTKATASTIFIIPATTCCLPTARL